MSFKSPLLRAMRNLTISFQGLRAGITSVNVQSQTIGALFNDVVREVARTDKENTLLKKELAEIRKELASLLKDHKKLVKLMNEEDKKKPPG